MTDATLDTSSFLRCYVVLALGLSLSFLPLGPVSGAAMLLLLIGTVWAYRLRAKNRHAALLANHARWQIRTVWIMSLYFLLATLLSGAIVSANADRGALQQIMPLLEATGDHSAEIHAAALQYMEANAALMYTTAAICCGVPALLGLLRMVKGYRRADAGLPVENVTSWRL
jgi:uncharacterized membrane protein